MKKLLHQLLLVCIVAMCYQGVSAQEKRVVSGTVKDSDGNLVMMATIKEKGTSNGGVFDAKDTFKISVAPDAVLVITSMGLEKTELKPNGDAINVQIQKSGIRTIPTRHIKNI